MDEFNNINREGENNQNQNGENGYTVTPQGGFYSTPKSEIIQDDVVSKTTSEPSEQTQQNYNSYTAGTNYSQSGYYQSQPYNYGYKPPKQPTAPKRYGAGIIIIAAVLAAVIGCFGGLLAAVYTADTDAPVVIDKAENGGSNVNINIDETVESVVEAVAVKVTPSVVGIRTTTSVISFFGGSSEAYPASVVGYNISSDLAVIKINVKGLTPAEIADSDKLKVGQYVITVGNPGGLEFMDSVTYGVISGLNRVVSSDSGIELIQTDAAINPGNSGGALVNTKGQLVGINSSKIVSEEFEGMGFAIPVNTVVEICDKIISKENSPEPYIGISISEKYTPSVLEYYGYPTGAVVLSVADASPAQNSGIRRGDIITEYKGKKITEFKVLEQLMEDSIPGEKVTVKLYRSGRYYSTTITVGSNNQVD